MANGNWIAGAVKNKGALHEHLGIPQGQKIPADRLSAAAKEGGVVGEEARLAKTLKGFKHGKKKKKKSPPKTYAEADRAALARFK